VEAKLAGGELGYEKYQLKAAGQLDRVDYLINASHQNFKGYREHSSSSGDLLNSKVRVALGGDDSLTIVFNHTDQPDEQDPGGIDAVQAEADPRSARAQNVLFNAGEELSQQRIGLVYRTDRLGGDLLLRNYYVWRDFANRLPFVDGGSVDLERFFYGAGAQYSLTDLASSKLNMTIGFDIDRQDDDRRRFDNNQGVLGSLVFDQQEQVDSNGIYVQGHYKLGSAWSVNAGLRYDDLQYTVTDRFLTDGDDSGRRDFSEVSPSVSVSYRTGSSTVFASYSSSFETPTTTELANPDGSGGFNQMINPQTADNYELGFRGANQNLSYELTIFQIDLEDELVPFELAAFPGRTFYSNAGSSSRSGVEMATSWVLGGGLSADVSYTWSEFEFDSFVDDDGNDFSGNSLPGLPRHFGYIGLHYESGKGISATLESVYSGKLFANTANTVSVPGYAVANFRVSHEFTRGNWTLRPYLGVNNLFGERYNSNIRINAFGDRFYEPAPGRNLSTFRTFRRRHRRRQEEEHFPRLQVRKRGERREDETTRLQERRRSRAHRRARGRGRGGPFLHHRHHRRPPPSAPASWVARGHLLYPHVATDMARRERKWGVAGAGTFGQREEGESHPARRRRRRRRRRPPPPPPRGGEVS
jgi:iron complex outermembrane receptor protein